MFPIHVILRSLSYRRWDKPLTRDPEQDDDKSVPQADISNYYFNIMGKELVLVQENL
jgi:hypothetical protein